jgi:hypothetical protein
LPPYKRSRSVGLIAGMAASSAVTISLYKPAQRW